MGWRDAPAVNAPQGARWQQAPSVEQQRPQQLTPMQFAAGLTGSAAQGASLGWADEVGAAIGAPVRRMTGQADSFREGFQQAREEGMNDVLRFREQHPRLAFGAELAGGLAAGGVGFVRSGASMAARNLPTLMRQGASTGGVLGAIGGAGYAEDDRLAGAAFGGAAGLVLGGLAPAAIRGGEQAANAARDWLSRRSTAETAGVRPATLNVMRDIMRADDSLGPIGQANISRAGPDAMLADAGPSARSLLDTAIQRSGPAGAVASRAIEGRAARANQTLGDALDTSLGRRGESPSREIVPYGAPRPNPTRDAYNAAYASPIDYSGARGMQIERTLGRVPGDIVRRANRLMQVEGEDSAQILARFADDGSATFERLPDVRQIDYITRALQDVSRRGDGQGALGGNTAEGRAYGMLARDLRRLLREEVPAYGDALERASSDIGKFQAERFGRTMLRPSVSRADVADELSDMSQIERRYAALGVREQFDDTLANVRRAVTDANMDAREAMTGLRELSSRASREKIGMLLGEDQAQALFRQLDQVSAALELRASTAANSRTFARTAMDEAVRGQTDDGVMNAIRRGEPMNVPRRLWQNLTGATEHDLRRQQDRTYEEIVRLLTEPQGPRAAATMREIAVPPLSVPPGALAAPPRTLGILAGPTTNRLFDERQETYQRR